MQRLLADIRAGRIDLVVIYKVDCPNPLTGRLRQARRDLRRPGCLVRLLTQHFNTTTSIGRLTLNCFCLQRGRSCCKASDHLAQEEASIDSERDPECPSPPRLFSV